MVQNQTCKKLSHIQMKAIKFLSQLMGNERRSSFLKEKHVFA